MQENAGNALLDVIKAQFAIKVKKNRNGHTFFAILKETNMKKRLRGKTQETLGN